MTTTFELTRRGECRLAVSTMDAGELREWLTEKYAFGYNGSYSRLVERAEKRLAQLMRWTTEHTYREILSDAIAMREEVQ